MKIKNLKIKAKYFLGLYPLPQYPAIAMKQSQLFDIL